MRTWLYSTRARLLTARRTSRQASRASASVMCSSPEYPSCGTVSFSPALLLAARSSVPVARSAGKADMGHDQTFRIVLIIFSLSVFPVGAYHRIRSQATRERLDRSQEGPFIL